MNVHDASYNQSLRWSYKLVTWKFGEKREKMMLNTEQRNI